MENEKLYSKETEENKKESSYEAGFREGKEEKEKIEGKEDFSEKKEEWIEILEEQADRMRNGEELDPETEEEIGRGVAEEFTKKLEEGGSYINERGEIVGASEENEEQRNSENIDSRTKEEKEKDYQEWKKYHENSGLAEVQIMQEIELAKENPVLREALEGTESKERLRDLAREVIEGKVKMGDIKEKNENIFEGAQGKQKEEGVDSESIKRQEEAEKVIEVVLEIEKRKDLLPYLNPENSIELLKGMKEGNLEFDVEVDTEKENLAEKILEKRGENTSNEQEEEQGENNKEGLTEENKEKDGESEEKEKKEGGKGGFWGSVANFFKNIFVIFGYLISSMVEKITNNDKKDK